jgi:putative lipoprotein
MTRLTFNRYLVLACIATLTACAANSDENTGSITGTVISQEDVELPEKVSLVVRLEEVSFGMTNYRIVTEKIIKQPGPYPIAFDLDYPLDAIANDKRYSVTATIYYGNRLLLRSDLVHYVLTNGYPDTAELVVRRAVLEP